jgi:RNA-directed DNA polymerase
VAPVKEAAQQLVLSFATAETPRPQRDAGGIRRVDRSAGLKPQGPKASGKPRKRGLAMEEVVRNLQSAFMKVAANQGAPGPDRQSIEALRKCLPTVMPKLSTGLLDGSYLLGDIRRVWIPKAGGGERGLGIPNVVDRVVQEAVRMVLEPFYELTFHSSSHGFRPDRSCQTAIAEAQAYVREGYEWVVDIDLEKFFDRVHHQRLMARLAQSISDKRLLVLIGRMLKAEVVLPDGVKVSTDEGVPQGGPLSPLLSNIVLSELDEELAARGLRFVRYADDCNIYVRSERAGKRVMASIERFISTRLRLKVNQFKSAVARPETRHFLGFRLRATDEQPEILLSERTQTRLAERVRELTPRSVGRSISSIIPTINRYIQGWTGFFGICTPGIARFLQWTDAHIRRRLRAIILRQWRQKYTVAKRLVKLGVSRKVAWRQVYDGRKNIWALSHNRAVDRGLRNAYFAERGLVSLAGTFVALWARPIAPVQLKLVWDTARS